MRSFCCFNKKKQNKVMILRWLRFTHFVYIKTTELCLSWLWLYLMCLCLIGLHICSYPTSVFPHGCLNRRNVFCLHSQQIFLTLVFCVKAAMLFMMERASLFLLLSLLDSSVWISRQKRDSCYSAASTAGSHWKTPNASSLCRPSL